MPNFVQLFRGLRQLNNTNQDYRPFILTAFHCIDAGKNYVLEQNEINEAQEWLVRFRFRHRYCTNSAYTFDDVITYDDTQFRAAWNGSDGSDFALVELQDCIAGDTYNRVTWLGWDRSNSTSSSGAGIHHPSGDVMKISFYNTSSTIDGNFMNFQFYDGVVEPGSSGSPIFNSNKRVIGQLLGTPNADPISCSNQDGIARYGRFFSSWTGGNTNTTRLSNWLDPGNTGAMTSNTIRGPIISGANVVCASSTLYTISNLPSGRTVSWSCISTNNNLTIDSTTGYAHSTSSTPGQGTISAVINTGCGNVTLPAKTVYIGKVEESKIVSSRDGMAVGAWAQVHILCNSGTTVAVAGYDSNGDGEDIGDDAALSSQSITAYEWSLPSGWSSSPNTTSPGEKQNERIDITPNWGNNPQPGELVQIGVRAQNDCGWTNWKYDYWQVISCGGYLMSVSPNPATDEATIELVSTTDAKAATVPEWELNVFSPGQVIKEKVQKIKDKTYKINIQGWQEGVYIVRAIVNGEPVAGKLVVKH